MTCRLFALLLVVVVLSACDIAHDPVRLGKQAVSEAQAYSIETEANQAALDAEQERYTQEQQDAITVAERAEREAITTAQIGKAAAWMTLALIIAIMGLGLSVAIVSLGASTATAINQTARATREMAKALGEFQRSAQLHPGPTGIFPGLVLPAGVEVKVLMPGTNSVLDSRMPRLPTTRETARLNELAARAAIAHSQVMAGSDQQLVLAQPGAFERQVLPAQAVRLEENNNATTI